MGRKYKEGDEHSRYSYERNPSEEVWADTDDGRRGESVTIKGMMIGLTADELLDYAYAQTRVHDSLAEKLLQHLPMKFKKRVEALRGPQEEARDAIRAARIILLNAQRPYERPPERP